MNMNRLTLVVLLLAAVAVGARHARRPARSSLPKIVGGTPVDITAAPHQVALFENTYFICGGSIISPGKVLTAAHCCDGQQAKHLKVRAGSTNFASGGSYHSTTAITMNPQYDASALDYDTCMLEVSPHFVLDDTRRAIRVTTEEPQFGQNVTVTGWGTTSEDDDVSVRLLSVTIPVVERQTCKDLYAPDEAEVSERMFCAGTPGHDHCYGDSGGALTQVDQDGALVLVGIVSWAIGCAREGYPGVNVNVAQEALRTWISTVGNV